MIKKIFISIACFMLVLSCFFISPITANASTGQTYTYDDSEVYSDTSNLGNYAIDSIESLSVNGALVYKATFTVNSDLTFRFVHSSAYTDTSSILYGNYFYLNRNINSQGQLDCNFAIRCLTSSTGIGFSRYGSTVIVTVNNVKYYKRDIILKSGQTFELFFSSVSFGGTFSDMTFSVSPDSDLLFSLVDSSSYLYSLVDMNSNTNFSLTEFDFDFISSNSFYLSAFFKRFVSRGGGLTNNLPSFSISASDLSNIPNSSGYIVTSRLFKDSTSVLGSTVGYSYFYSANSVSYTAPWKQEVGYYFDSFYFLINRPVFRTNNTLILYNFDYGSFLNSVETTTYRLIKGNDNYDVVYNGSLPNSYFVYIYNTQVANILFDEYIYLFFSFGDRLIFYDEPFPYHNSPSYEEPFFSLGFDFNFTYYNEPLVSSNGSYNFDFQKPGYVDMRFSLYPFYIPILEAVQNALIFLLFYCPIISDILAFIHLDQFFGALFNIFSFETGNITLLGINMGSFVWACISFLIFFKLLRSFMPILWSSRAEASSSWSDLMSKPDKLREKERIAHHKEIYRKHKENLKVKKSDKVKIRGQVYSKKYLNSLYDNIDDIDL